MPFGIISDSASLPPDAGILLVDQEKIWSSPFRTSKNDAKWWAVWGGTVRGLIAADRYIERKAPNNATLVRIGNGASYLGESYTLLPIAAGMFIGTAKGSDHFRETGMLSFETIADVTILLKAARTGSKCRKAPRLLG
jgi:hypothetical protein